MPRRSTRLQEAGGRVERMSLTACSCLIALLIYSVFISVAFNVITALYGTISSCKNIRIVGKVQEITNVDILDYDGSDNTNKETVDDDNIATAGMICTSLQQLYCIVVLII